MLSRKFIRAKVLIESDAVDEPDVSQSVSNSEITPIKKIVNKIIYKVILLKIKGNNIIENQRYKIELEDQESIKNMEYSRLFVYITSAQIFLIIFLGIYNIYSFRNFLISKHLI